MQFTINQAEMMEALKTVKCLGRSALPILNHVLIEAKEGTVIFTMTDLTMLVTFTAAVTVTVAEEGTYAVDYQQLLNTVKALPKKAEIVVQRLEGSIEIACAGRKFVRGMDAEDYPTGPTVRMAGDRYTETRDEFEVEKRTTNTYTYEVLETPLQQLCLPREQLATMLNQAAYAAAQDDSRPIFQAIYTELKEDTLTMVTADAFRLLKHGVEVPGAGSWEYPVLIPAKYFVHIVKLLPKECGVDIEVRFTCDKAVEKNGQAISDAPTLLKALQVCFTTETTTILLRPIEGTYPNYRGIVPKGWDTRLVCATAELLRGYQALLPVAKDASNITTLRVVEDKAWIEATAEGLPEPTVHEVSGGVTGPTVQTILNCQYMLAFLKATKAPEVAIELTSSARPVVARPLGGVPGEETLYVVMPMSVNR
ncbi:DNA polymerase III subunit beta [Reticulibacter mediterranei]|uniref:DNA polymerase III subunit beta n=1 Tax=Reticulibacter mediterranei TaxID=2778369 RepID=A0A8J3ITR9_9CHLR|nr:DNA polymerase III subunit beta [Reticulibacter mediterranei]GHP00632.1 DNA polymerase III subunit beta [Reticulibacter mediterranei]